MHGKMHSIDELGANVPAFLAKLWKIVEDPETNDLICWSPGGTSFFIRNQARFARELLPLYYKHNNMASFVRQLNMYGFHKVVSIDGGGLKLDKDEMEFAHQYFLMRHPYLLEHIKRKISTTHKVEEGRPGAKPEVMNKVLADVKNMKGRQDTLDNQLNAVKRENEVLWREVAILRQKHLKQQQIVNKLIQFLVSMVQSSRNGGIGIKRHYPLMLNDTSHRPRKVSKLSSDLSDLNTAPSSMSPTGPVIHELDATDLLEECEPNIEEGEEAPVVPTQGNFLPSEFCNVEEASDAERRSPSSTSKRAMSASPDPIAMSPSPQVLLELAEECPLSPSMLLTASPMEVNPSIVAPRLGKGKLRSRIGSTESRRRKSKKIIKSKDGSSFSVTPESSENSQEVEDNGVDLLAVLPTLTESSAEGENKEETSSESLAAATDAAIMAISNVAAATNKQIPMKSLLASSGKSVGKTAVNSSLPLMNDLSAASSTQHASNPKLKLKQEPTMSIDMQTDPSNMTLACTGSNIDESAFGSEDLDNHVDTMQTELDTLRDLLKGEGYSLDANTLLGVCAAIPAFEQDFIKLFSDDPMSDLPNAAFENIPDEQDKNNTTGNELATYSSNLLDMVDMFEGPGTGDWSAPGTPDSSIMDVSLSELNTPQMAIVSPSLVSKKK